jgi:hypothetical protein
VRHETKGRDEYSPFGWVFVGKQIVPEEEKEKHHPEKKTPRD